MSSGIPECEWLAAESFTAAKDHARERLAGVGSCAGVGCNLHCDADHGCTEGERDGGAELTVEPVDLQAQRWFQESGTVEFGDRRWILTGEPVFDPMVEYVGEFQGTPLYAEVGVSPPYSKLFIPLENDYWQTLTPGQSTGPDTLEGQPRGVPGVD